jgi:IS1 family transposase
LDQEKKKSKNIKLKILELESAFSNWRNSRKKKKAWQEELKKSKPEEQIIYEKQRSLLCDVEKKKKAKIKSIGEDLEAIQTTFDDLRSKVNPIFKELVESRNRIIRFIHKDKMRKSFFFMDFFVMVLKSVLLVS